MNTIYCFGEALIQLFPRDPETDLQDAIYFKKHLGGAAAVSAYTTKCLNGTSAFIGNISEDGFGDFISHTLKNAGVNMTTCTHSEEWKTPIMIATGLEIGDNPRIYRSESEKKTTLDVANIRFEESDILHLSPQSSGMTETIRVLMEAASASGCTLSVAMDDWLNDEYLHLFQENLSRFDFVFISRESLIRITGANEEKAIQKELENATATIVFEKDGKTLLYTGDTNQVADKSQLQRINTNNYQAVFSGAFLHKYISHSGEAGLTIAKALEEAFRFATAAADIGASHRSGTLPFPALAEVQKLFESKKAMKSRSGINHELAKKAEKDYYRLAYHIMPECGWLNDPNGLIQYRGKYHAFYQHYPHAPEWGTMYWGHVISDDLLHWEYLPIALSPDQVYERSCFSGSAVDNDGELTLIYTAHDNTRTPKEVQCIATSTDGVHFTKYEKNPVIAAPPPGFDDNFRDPKVFRHGDLWYMVVGSSQDNNGCVVLYSSRDLRTWDYRGPACKSDGTQGDMWECPDLFELDGTWIIVTSPMNMKNSKSIFITGDMDFKANLFAQRRHRNVDYGFEFYAPQTFKDDKGRRILIAWMDMWGGEFPTQRSGWAGALTFPRELYMEDGEVRQKPVEELRLLRKKQLRRGNLLLKDNEKNTIREIRGDCLEIAFTLSVPQQRKGCFTLYIRASEDQKEKTVLSVNFESKILTVDKRHSGQGKGTLVQIPYSEAEKEIPIHILIDKSSVEFFLCRGKYTITNRIYPHSTSVFYDMFTEGVDITIPNFDAYELG